MSTLPPPDINSVDWGAHRITGYSPALVQRLLATERERYTPLMQAVEWLLDDGHMNQEHLARLRAAWEGCHAT